MLIKKIAIAPALIALTVAVTSLAVIAGPSGGDKNGGDHGGGGGKNGGGHGGGHDGGGDGKNGGDGGKNGGRDGGRRGEGGEGKRCSAYRTTLNYRHCIRYKRYARARMVPCMRGDEIVYDYGCGRRVVVRQPRIVYDGPETGYGDEQVVTRRSYRRLTRRERIRQRRVVVADVGGYGDYGHYDGGYAGVSRAARLQQERRLRKRSRARAEYGYSYGNGYYDDYGYAQRRLKHRKLRRRHAVPVDYGYGYDNYDPGVTIHYGPTILKNGAY